MLCNSTLSKLQIAIIIIIEYSTMINDYLIITDDKQWLTNSWINLCLWTFSTPTPPDIPPYKENFGMDGFPRVTADGLGHPHIDLI